MYLGPLNIHTYKELAMASFYASYHMCIANPKEREVAIILYPKGRVSY